MKENLINDREIAFLSKQLATIDVDAPIEVDVDKLKYEGKDLEKLVPFYQEMNFNSFLDKLQITAEPVEMEDILFSVVEEVTEDMFQGDTALYVEMMGDNYHLEDIVGVAWGNQEKIYVSNREELFESPVFTDWLKDEKRKKFVYDAKRTYVGLNRYTTAPKGIAFDVLLAAYLLDTNDTNNDIAGVAAHYGYDAIQSDEAIYGKGAKKGCRRMRKTSLLI